MKNLTLGWPNYVDVATLSGGYWMPTLPLQNLKDARLLQIARSMNALKSSTVINFDFQRARSVGALSISNVNFSSAGKFRWVGSDTSNYAVIRHTTPWQWAWDQGAIPESMREWDGHFWSGIVSEEARAGLRCTFVTTIESRPSLRYWRLEIDDETNPDGAIHIGRPFVSDTWTVSKNFSWGDSTGLEDSSEFDKNLGDEEFCSPSLVRRIAEFSLDHLTADEIYARAIDMQRKAGRSSELLVIPDPDDTENAFRRNFLCRFQNLSPLINDKRAKRSIKFQFREIL